VKAKQIKGFCLPGFNNNDYGRKRRECSPCSPETGTHAGGAGYLRTSQQESRAYDASPHVHLVAHSVRSIELTAGHRSRDDGEQHIQEIVMHLLRFVHGNTSMNPCNRTDMFIPFVEPS